MKSTTQVKPKPPIELPYLVKHPCHNMVVLATHMDGDGIITGTCVHHGGDDYHNRLGEYDTHWDRTFVYYDGSVTLEN